jgi:hypothetical protein
VYGSSKIPANASDYQPKFSKGARLPHAWISFPESTTVAPPAPVDVSYVDEYQQLDIEKRKYSTLDLIKPDSFTILSAKRPEWDEVLATLKRVPGLKNVPLQIAGLGSDFELADTPSGHSWLRDSRLESGRTLLVRPDQHILEAFDKGVAVGSIERVLKAHLGLA